MIFFHLSFPPFVDSGRAVVSYWRKNEHLVLVDLLGGLSLSENPMVRLT